MSADTLSAQTGVPAGQGRSLPWWAMTMTIATEGMLFALLLFVYYYLYSLADAWPLGGIEPPKLLTVSVRTGLLLLSSVTMSAADRAVRRNAPRATKGYLALTFVLGAVFLAGHVEEMLRLPSEFTWSTNAYGSLFYVIVNFHGVHLVIGLALLAFAYGAVARGRSTADHHEGLVATGMYWHFVDVVWAFVFPTLYLVPNFLPR